MSLMVTLVGIIQSTGVRARRPALPNKTDRVGGHAFHLGVPLRGLTLLGPRLAL